MHIFLINIFESFFVYLSFLESFNPKSIDLVMAISKKLIVSLKIKNIEISETNSSHQ